MITFGMGCILGGLIATVVVGGGILIWDPLNKF